LKSSSSPSDEGPSVSRMRRNRVRERETVDSSGQSCSEGANPWLLVISRLKQKSCHGSESNFTGFVNDTRLARHLASSDASSIRRETPRCSSQVDNICSKQLASEGSCFGGAIF